MNFFRSERFKVENVIFVSVILGLYEFFGIINSYFFLLVDEFLILWEGWNVGGKVVKGVLLCVVLDLLGVRKVLNLIML